MKFQRSNASVELDSAALKGLGFAFLAGNLPLLFLVSVPLWFKLLCAAGGFGILAMGYLSSSKVEWRSKLADMGIYFAILLAMLNQFLMNAMGEVGSGLFWSVLVLFYLLVYRKTRLLICFIILHIFLYFFLDLALASSGLELAKFDNSNAYIFRWLGFLVCSVWTLAFLSRAMKLETKDQKEQTVLRNKNQEEITNHLFRSLSGGIAHEINNPLQIINGSASKLSRLQFSSADDLATVRLLQHKLIRASQIIGLFVKSIHTPAATFKKREASQFSVTEPIEKVLIELGLIADSVVEGPSHLEVHSNLDALEQILRSLCQNAKEAAPQGQRPSVKLQYKVSDEGLEIMVLDFGIGIKSSDLESVFEPFYTTKNYSHHLGLGLSNSRAAAEELGGALEVLQGSDPTIFRLTIPQEEWNI